MGSSMSAKQSSRDSLDESSKQESESLQTFNFKSQKQ